MPEIAVLIVAGLQVPVIAGVLAELTGSEGAVLFWHNGPIAANIGVTWVTMVILRDVVKAH